MREIALAHARRGFKVFPNRAGEKKPPMIPSWLMAATTDEARISEWWTQWPGANVGIHCDGLLVIDVDPKKGGFESLAALEQEVQLYATYEVETQSGGRHLYYRCAGGARNGVDVLGVGLDIRTTAGYVLAAGSRTAAGPYRVYVDEPIADVAPAIVDRAAARGRDVQRSERSEVVVDTDADAAVARAIAHLRGHPVATQGAGGDHHTFRTICRIRDFGVPQERALEALAEWNARCVPPWESGELAVKIENAYAYAQDAAGKLTPEALGFTKIEGSQPAVNGADQPQTEDTLDDVEMVHPADVEAKDVLGSEYLIKGVIERESNAVLFGQWNVGKTFVILDMAAAIATGQPWFGRRVRQGRVLYLGYEGIRAMRKRIVALKRKHPLLSDRKTPFAWAPLRNPLITPEGDTELRRALKKFGREHKGPPALVIIDPLANALGGDDSDATLMGELNRRVNALMKAYKCTVLRVHHSGHGNQDRARGHSSLPAGVDTEIRVTKDSISTTKQRDDVPADFSFRLIVEEVGKDADGDKVTTCVVKQIEPNPLDPELTGPLQELFDELVKLRGDGGTVTRTDVSDCSPNATPKDRRKWIMELERKMYLRADGTKWVICERGPLAIFD
jgi:hypothetical protein